MMAIFIATALCVSEQQAQLVPTTRVGWICFGTVTLWWMAILTAQTLEGDALFPN
jgi:hypothetical protein